MVIGVGGDDASIYIMQWIKMDVSRKCILYKHLKAVFKLEPYLMKLSRNEFQYIVKFSCCNHNWQQKTGWYSGIDRRLRYCDSVIWAGLLNYYSVPITITITITSYI